MARERKGQKMLAITPDQDGIMKEVKNQAEENFGPIPSTAESELLLKLLELISPGIVVVPVKGQEGKTCKQLREPLLMVSWDRGAGRWKWAVNDRTYKYTVYGHLETLIGLAEGIEDCLRTGKYAAKSTEVT